jgi:hypothetical protein
MSTSPNTCCRITRFAELKCPAGAMTAFLICGYRSSERKEKKELVSREYRIKYPE